MWAAATFSCLQPSSKELILPTIAIVGAGPGLGLSIVRAIADAHDADLTPRAQPAGGLAVTVRFPSRNGAGARRDSA